MSRVPLLLAFALAGVVLLPAPPAARADDPPLPAAGGAAPPPGPPPAPEDAARQLDAPPPELPRGRDAYLLPTERTDLVAYLGSLRKQIEQFETPPPATPEVTALLDAWKAVLKPRIGRMLRRLDKWQDPERWIWEEGQATPTSLQPDQWRSFTRDMAALATELHGAYQQYGSVKLKPKRLQAGYVPPIPTAPRTYLGYPYPTLYGGIVDRQAAGTVLGRWSSGSYWHLLNRFRYAYDWSWARRAYWYEHWQSRIQATDDLFEDLRAELDGTQAILGQTLLGLQVFIAALQNAEEERLLGLCESCRTDDETLREMGVTALDAMSQARLEAERYRGDSSAAYGTLLRKWLRAQKAATRVMEVAHEPEEPEVEDAD